MRVLALELSGPLQSWGTHSRAGQRGTEFFPSKSGVLGLLAAALGRRREEGIDDLRSLRVHARTDHPGEILSDFQTIGVGYARDPVWPNAVWTVEGKRKRGDLSQLVSERHFLADAAFLVLVEGTDELVDELAAAVRSPRFQLALGRRGCPPSQPLCRFEPEGIDPCEVLERYPRLRGSTGTLEAIQELGAADAASADDYLPDQPLGASGGRRFGARPIRWLTVDPPTYVPVPA